VLKVLISSFAGTMELKIQWTYGYVLFSVPCFLFAGVFISAFSAFVIFWDTQLSQRTGWAIAVATVLGCLAVLCLIVIIRQPQNKSSLNFKVSMLWKLH